jgi:hypothetical protein
MQAQRILALQAARSPQDPRIGFLLAQAYMRLADASFFARDYQSALSCYEEVRQRFLKLSHSLPSMCGTICSKFDPAMTQ